MDNQGYPPGGSPPNTQPSNQPPPYQGNQPPYQQPYYPQQGYPVPPEIAGRWNWGAFAFSIWWGIGNRAYLPLLCLVPLLNIVWIFICGANGNKWAWEAGGYYDVRMFQMVQEPWNRAGKVAFIIFIAVLAFYILIAIVAGSAAFIFGR